ncbi:hypothetical protein [Phenylobacterium sp. J367]|uniref:hypothetical protein n=1 Tax=Phenylobacterium sp. J367 TaxID=2898435 RepID=UPI002151CBA2|nr:hypothetical protein [Phenylobacterium sp. J367]MCR5878544.1 hypothetical protein [Phenylobacterium sp. J367]
MDFVREHVRSVWALELLLLLKRDPTRCWQPAELVRELRASQALVHDNLVRFERGGLVRIDDTGCYGYAPAGSVLAELSERLEAAYRERPVAIINLIAKPSNPVQGLADAFKFRGDGQ